MENLKDFWKYPEVSGTILSYIIIINRHDLMVYLIGISIKYIICKNNENQETNYV